MYCEITYVKESFAVTNTSMTSLIQAKSFILNFISAGISNTILKQYRFSFLIAEKGAPVNKKVVETPSPLCIQAQGNARL